MLLFMLLLDQNLIHFCSHTLHTSQPVTPSMAIISATDQIQHSSPVTQQSTNDNDISPFWPIVPSSNPTLYLVAIDPDTTQQLPSIPLVVDFIGYSPLKLLEYPNLLTSISLYHLRLS